jgi:hypothetical protein
LIFNVHFYNILTYIGNTLMYLVVATKKGGDWWREGGVACSWSFRGIAPSCSRWWFSPILGRWVDVVSIGCARPSLVWSLKSPPLDADRQLPSSRRRRETVGVCERRGRAFDRRFRWDAVGGGRGGSAGGRSWQRKERLKAGVDWWDKVRSASRGRRGRRVVVSHGRPVCRQLAPPRVARPTDRQMLRSPT